MARTTNGILLPSGWGPSGKKFLAEAMSLVVSTTSKNWGWSGRVPVHTPLLISWAAFCSGDGQVLQSLRPVPTSARASQIQALHNQKVSPKGKRGSKQEQKCWNLGDLVHATSMPLGSQAARAQEVCLLVGLRYFGFTSFLLISFFCYNRMLSRIDITLHWAFNVFSVFPNCGSLFWSFTHLIFVFLPTPYGLWDLSSPTRIKPRPQQWERWVLTTGLPGSSWPWYIFEEYWSGGFVDCPQISVFLMISLEVMTFRKEYHTGEVFFSSRLIRVMISTWVIPGDINLEVVFTGLLHCKIIIFPLPYFIHKRPITKPSLHQRRGELEPTSEEGSVRACSILFYI